MFARILTFASALLSGAALADHKQQVSMSDGLIKVASAFTVSETVERLEDVLKAKGMKVFATIDHSKGAQSVGNSLRPTTLVIFGNPKVGSPLMVCSQTTAIDLPQKALVWEDEQGKVWLTYNSPQYMKQRHAIEGCDAVLEKVTGALAAFTNAATGNKN